ncbi:metal ABC transporter ATP-binding protein [Roseospira marina]|uniref:Metal ABC transporter ATP-binding protein n=2 Tax=Roseospira marina TaxID=140057 RepID=A0A5M6IFX9_9PROT|nr:metal ABC transporter ATP-binding protein [Roseospira marina]KAA5607163.1 metal ABC transporter ATP-binding protein [Roseospira marina]MBB4312814.1 zinc transport system ATP-binding protein [Roseospira marina]MBB5086413.1 zinc transport system ATP-binding protein [Roseospira marina]
MRETPPGDGAATGAVLASARDLGIARNGRWLVQGIDLCVRRGEIVTLIGPNGSGKSTTAKAVIGLMKADAGSVWRTPGLRIGYVPQKLAMDRTLPLTVARLLTLTHRQPRAAVHAALEAVGIPHLANAQVHGLSGGEFQRALLARAMLRDPDLLVLDEPVQGVDVQGEAALYSLISQIRERTGCGILMISHDLHVVMAATDTVICLNGRVSCRGTPQAVISNPAYQRLFGRTGADMLAVYRHHEDGTAPCGHAGHDHQAEPDEAAPGSQAPTNRPAEARHAG